MTADGAAITIAASTAKADPTNIENATINRLTAIIQTPDGASVTAHSDEGSIEDAQKARLKGDVFIETSSGYRISTDELISDLDKTLIESAGSVAASGPVGDIDAGKMIVHLQNQTGTSMLVFKNGIRVLYNSSPSK